MANKLELTWYGKDEPIRVEPRLLIENTALSNTAADPDTQNMLQLFPLLRMLLHPLVCGSGSFRVHGAYPAPVRLKLFIRLGILEGHELTVLSAFIKSLQFGTFRFCDFSLSNSRRTISPG